MNSYFYSSHYAQAYLQTAPQPQPVYPQPTPPQVPNWYQPGSHRCTHKQCAFSGSKKAVETHMMDRHLIYPPNYSKDKKHSDWDADPSLKGKPIPIQGTNVILNSPEEIEAWIAERRKRFPTANRVTEKKEKLKQAISRGQLHLDDNPRFSKRPRGTPGFERGRARGRGRGAPSRGRGSGYSKPTPLSLPPRPQVAVRPTPSSSDVSSDPDDDGLPETFSSKPPEPLSLCQVPTQTEQILLNQQSERQLPPSAPPTQIKKPFTRQPKNPPSNPFASKPSLLRNLLLPEIRNTVSNLSQAIRFLVDNDFLENVELEPGDAGQQRIQVIKSEEHSERERVTI